MTTAEPSVPPPAELSGYLCFAIYSANLAIGRAYRPILDALGLTYPQYIVLIALCEEDGRTVSALGEKLFLESNTLTPLLKKLETAGYVRRERGRADGRQVLVSLTAEGRKLREQGLSMTVAPACGPDAAAVAQLQQAVVMLRDTVIAALPQRQRPEGHRAVRRRGVTQKGDCAHQRQ